ncbi:solute carrier family 35 member F5 isoform X2 [Hyperolius riggenbachi]|uniref:solute carrier family 35 member F5 isoform X2 n=1 Tax=Hyperolius riggenbachi TaxID=752182 RepID=UPI0035A2C256
MNRVLSSPVGPGPQRRRLLLGILLLLLVDVIWVASSELTSYIFQEFNKPFFSTFAKTSMFILYLLGFAVWQPWRQQCSNNLCGKRTKMSEPLYVPVKFHDLQIEKISGSKSANYEKTVKKSRVRFSNLMEVRQLPSSQALEAKLSRMANPPVRDCDYTLRTSTKFTVCQVAKISFVFCFVWFLANYSYQEALSETQVAIVNIISSTSGLFTLILASVFPSNSGDRFTLSKLLAVTLSIGGIILVSLSGSDASRDKDSLGCLWSLLGAALYAVYVVMIKRKVDREDKLDIPMFFGFVGLFNLLLLWPGFFLLHYTSVEAFELPNKLVWMYLVINGLVGTVLSEFLWLWGCFLTSSLIGTLALSLTIPLSIIADICMQKVSFSWVFFAGALPVFISFFIVTLLCHYNNWDPVMVGLRRIFAFVCRKHRIARTSEDTEQSENLIPLHSVSSEEDSSNCS